ncbi:UNVERIFIED_CONTAM: hypothetical protein K2H54_013396 [Gekko kuhli]
MDAALDQSDYPNYTYSPFPNDSISYENVSEGILSRNATDYGREMSIDIVVFGISMWVICIFGAVGNGIVIWFLGFRIKRNPFSTYILNLAIADFGVLLSAAFIVADLWIVFLHIFPIMLLVLLFLFLSTYSSSQFLLTAISIDRCVAVFFPLWHRCHRPPHLSTIVCALIWVLSFLFTAVTYTLMRLNSEEKKIEEYYQFMVNALLCLPVMTITTVSLFIKVCLKARQHRRGKLLTIVLLTLLFFLLFAFPLNVTVILYIFDYKRKDKSRPRSRKKKLRIMTDISLTTLPIMEAALDYNDNPKYTYSSFPNDSINYENVSEEISSHNTTDYGRGKSSNYHVVTAISMWVICIFGAVGNGIVIWLLGFRIKGNTCSAYILNLAIADLGVLLSVAFIAAEMWIVFLHVFPIMAAILLFLFLSMYSSSQFLLTAISIDRCVAVFFPLWHRCHRPPHLSTTVCALIWLLSFLLTAITYNLIFLKLHETKMAEYYQLVANALLCLPVMTIATVSLFIKVCSKARQRRRGKLLTVILLTLLFFLLFAFPFNVVFLLHIFNYLPSYASDFAMLLACLNSSVNPAIYILVGRQGKSRKRESMKMVFQKIFKEEESCLEETPVETQL